MIRTLAATLAALFICMNATASGPTIDDPKDAVAAELRGGDEGLPPVTLAWPLCAKTHSEFGYRVDPFTGRVAFHAGLDMGDAFGLKVRAAHGGQVVAAERRGPYGLMVEIKNPNGYGTRYAQLRAAFVKPGDEIGEGHVIGEVGATGRATGPHLHFEVWRDDRVWDPRKMLPPEAACGK